MKYCTIKKNNKNKIAKSISYEDSFFQIPVGIINQWNTYKQNHFHAKARYKKEEVLQETSDHDRLFNK